MDLNYMLIKSTIVSPIQKYLKKEKSIMNVKQILFTKTKLMINGEVIQVDYSDIPQIEDFAEFSIFIDTEKKTYDISAVQKNGELIEMKNI